MHIKLGFFKWYTANWAFFGAIAIYRSQDSLLNKGLAAMGVVRFRHLLSSTQEKENIACQLRHGVPMKKAHIFGKPMD